MHMFKRLLTGFCMAAVLTAGAAVTASASEIYLGDVETDGSVNVADIIKLQKHLLGVQPLQYPENIAADLNQDGAVDVFDLALAKRAVLSGNWVLYEYEEELTHPPMPTQPPEATDPATEPTTEPVTDPTETTEPPVLDELTLYGGILVPEQLEVGKPVIVEGIVTSDASPISSVTVGVYDDAGNLMTGKTVTPDTQSYDLHLLDSYIMFNKLPEGSYYYQVTASNASFVNVTLDYQPFTVGTPASDPGSDVPDDPITLSDGTSIPASLAQGKAVSVKGTLSSGSVLTSVTAGIYDTSGNLVTGKTVSPNTQTYDLHQLDSDILFNKLSPGDYIYRITAENADGTQIVDEQKFTVTAPDGLTYINGILIVNKSYSVPSSYNPGGLTVETQKAFDEMAAAAALDGISLRVYSGFRSYSYQSQIYNNYVAGYGQATADTFSARPGYSEHQTGLAIDVNTASDSFIGTREQLWLADNCWKFGFIIRYPEGKQDITGYKYEPWHVRYLGKEMAQTIYDSGLTLEEYLGIDSYYH